MKISHYEDHVAADKPNPGDQRRHRSAPPPKDLTPAAADRPRLVLSAATWSSYGCILFIQTSRTLESLIYVSRKCPGTPGKFLEAFGGFESCLEVSVSREPDIGYAALSSGERAI